MLLISSRNIPLCLRAVAFPRVLLDKPIPVVSRAATEPVRLLYPSFYIFFFILEHTVSASSQCPLNILLRFCIYSFCLLNRMRIRSFYKDLPRLPDGISNKIRPSTYKPLVTILFLVKLKKFRSESYDVQNKYIVTGRPCAS